MLILQIIIICCLVAVMRQDFLTRTIHWVLIALSGLLLGINCYLENRPTLSLIIVSKNMAFLVLLMVILACYYFIKQRSVKNIVNVSIGSGDLFSFLSWPSHFHS